MKKFPNKVKYSRPHKIKIIKGTKGHSFSKFQVGVRLKSATYLTYEQLEAARRTIIRLIKPKELKNRKNAMFTKNVQHKMVRRFKKRRAKHKNFFFIRSNICLPITRKPLQVRMGKGKGTLHSWVFPAGKSRIIFEMSRQRFKISKIVKLMKISRKRMPKKLKLIYHRNFLRRETIFYPVI